jgi:hypothetical protein
MMCRQSLRIQCTAILTAALFLFATTASLSASAQPLPSSKAVPAAKPAAKPQNANSNKSAKSLSTFIQASATNNNTPAPTTTTFIGSLVVTGFTVASNVLYATGTITGNAVGSTETLSSPFMLPVTAIDPQTCTILTLSLGALDLDITGLVVHLNPVFLTITAVPGAGNLLGNLLCDVANLLNGGGTLSTLLGQISSLLTQILGAL